MTGLNIDAFELSLLKGFNGVIIANMEFLVNGKF
jgi:hypothetical protein